MSFVEYFLVDAQLWQVEGDLSQPIKNLPLVVMEDHTVWVELDDHVFPLLDYYGDPVINNSKLLQEFLHESGYHSNQDSKRRTELLRLLCLLSLMALSLCVGYLYFAPEQNHDEVPPAATPSLIDVNKLEIGLPYQGSYKVVQAEHGSEYNQRAIDLAAGWHEPIISPISGVVREVRFNEYGNSVLVIQNEQLTVTMWHLEISVEVGQQLELGEIVGQEGNLGYVTDLRGKECSQVEKLGPGHCGHHLHIFFQDTQTGQNLDPMEVLNLDQTEK